MTVKKNANVRTMLALVLLPWSFADSISE